MKQRTIPYHKIARCVVMIFITATITANNIITVITIPMAYLLLLRICAAFKTAD